MTRPLLRLGFPVARWCKQIIGSLRGTRLASCNDRIVGNVSLFFLTSTNHWILGRFRYLWWENQMSIRAVAGTTCSWCGDVWYEYVLLLQWHKQTRRLLISTVRINLRWLTQTRKLSERFTLTQTVKGDHANRWAACSGSVLVFLMAWGSYGF